MNPDRLKKGSSTKAVVRAGTNGAKPPQPPFAAIRPETFTHLGETRIDEYSWLRNAADPEVQAYIKAENEYADAYLKGTKKLQTQIYKEIRARMKENDMSVPVKDGPYLYYSRTKKGKQYAIHCRKLESGGREEVILDENTLAQDQKYFSLGTVEVSPDHSLLAYTVDYSGSEQHQLFIKDLRTGTLLTESIDSVGDVEWLADSAHIVYTREQHPHPPRSVFVHSLGQSGEDRLVYEESDMQWYVALDKSKSERYIFIVAANFDTTEVRYFDASDPGAVPVLFAPRTKDVKYFPEHHGDYFYIMTNERAVNFRIMRTRIDAPHKKSWEMWLPHDKERSYSGMMLCKDFFAITVREKGSEQIYLHTAGETKGRILALPEKEHVISLWHDLEYESPYIRLSYQSFLTPNTVYDYEVAKRTLTIKKQAPVPGWNAAKYESKREWVSSGNVSVPVTLVYAKKTKRDGTAPLLLDCYGAYGITHDPHFSISRQTLLDRGWVVAFGHPRGGGEMGWNWHKQAKLMTKHHTYEDVVAIAEYLRKKKYVAKDKLVLVGGSAGGMMVGAVLNMRPDLFRAAISYVPAADTVTSMLDESLGGTRLHYDEMGDPREPKMYRYLLKWSPYEGVRRAAYPALLVRANMNDIRTPYWEAAKWVARLRAKKTDDNPLLLKTETVAGHFGKSGRYEWIKDRAFDYAFLITTLASPDAR